MASQIGTTREYTSTDESSRSNLTNCPNCKINVVPRGITTSRKDDLAAGEKKHCPSCGHVFGNNSLLVRKVRAIVVTGAGGDTIAADGGTKQMAATVSPDYADNKSVTWSVDDAAKATISETGLLTAVADGTVKVIATAKDGTGAVGWLNVTISNQA